MSSVSSRSPRASSPISLSSPSVEADDGQRAACLVQMRLRKLQLGRAFVFVLRGLVDGPEGLRQCLIDFALDPGQRTQILLCGLSHEYCLVARGVRIKP